MIMDTCPSHDSASIAWIANPADVRKMSANAEKGISRELLVIAAPPIGRPIGRTRR
jgi:hypothetical protein